MAFEQNEGRKQAKWISGGSVSRQGERQEKRPGGCKEVSELEEQQGASGA